METVSSISKLIRPNHYFTKIDLVKAYYSIPIAEEHHKMLKFEHNNQLFSFQVLPNGYTHGPRIFTKILKPPLAHLRKKGVNATPYLDDILNMHSEYKTCFENTKLIISSLQDLGFCIHPEPKSSLIPNKQIIFLGFIFNSENMTIKLTDEKKTKLINHCITILGSPKITIRELAQILGKISSSFPGVKYGRLHYRGLERQKTAALRQHRGNFNAQIYLSEEAIVDIQWWIHNTQHSKNQLFTPNPSKTIFTDSSSYGWGAANAQTSTGGLLTEGEKENHINVLELKAILFGLMSLENETNNCHLKIESDNTTAVYAVNKFGTSKSKPCDDMAKQIWAWAIHKNIWLSATHIPGILNVQADEESRKQETFTEWKLNPNLFNYICTKLKFIPDIDLFATRINTQLKTFFSYRPDPECIAVDAFLMNWDSLKFWAFPPFACIPKVLQKIYLDKAQGILIVPDWPSQPWYTNVHKISEQIITISPSQDLLLLPHQPHLLHPLHKKLTLLGCYVNGAISH